MSIINIIISKQQAEFLPKERYLKFVEYEMLHNFTVYTRYDYTQDMFSNFDEKEYRLSENGKNLLERVVSLQNNEVYWSAIHLENNMGEREVSDNCFKRIKNRDFTKISLSKENLLSLSYDTLYKL